MFSSIFNTFSLVWEFTPFKRVEIEKIEYLFKLIFWVFLVFYCLFIAYLQNKTLYFRFKIKEKCLVSKETDENAYKKCISNEEILNTEIVESYKNSPQSAFIWH